MHKPTPLVSRGADIAGVKIPTGFTGFVFHRRVLILSIAHFNGVLWKIQLCTLCYLFSISK